MGKKRPNSFSVKLARMTFAMEENESLSPVPGLFSPPAQVPQTRRITDLIEQLTFWHLLHDTPYRRIMMQM